MAQAKGVLPRGEDKEVLYKNPRMCGYFIAARLDPNLDRGGAEAWLGRVDDQVTKLVERLPPREGQEKGDKVAAVAIGLARSFFFSATGEPRFNPPLQPPNAFAPDAPQPLPNSVAPLANVPAVDGDVLFYVASVFEARVNEFIGAVDAMPEVASLTFDRGYQRTDDTEPFGYLDGVRNIRRSDRPDFVFVDRDDRHLEEPAWAHGGSYMAFLKIRQHPPAFEAVGDESARDAVIGRTKAGFRVDIAAQRLDPKLEPPDPPVNLLPSAHVRKVGPRGKHDDTQIFRRGLPFIESSPEGQPRVGLHFCSFQASLDQFDVAFNDWMMNPRFPADGAGADALLDPARPGGQLTTIEKVGFFFVPPHLDEGLAAAVFKKPGRGVQVEGGAARCPQADRRPHRPFAAIRAERLRLPGRRQPGRSRRRTVHDGLNRASCLSRDVGRR